MKKQGYYSSGQFARMAQVSVRTIRYYDKMNLLKPSYISEGGARFYTDSDLAHLQQILLLKYLGFSLEDILEMTIGDTDYKLLLNALKIQQKLVEDRLEQLDLVRGALSDTVRAIETDQNIDWSQMLHLIHLTGVKKSLTSQYKNAANISARIRLHQLFSRNPEGWFPWIFRHLSLKNGMKVLELGCGSGSLWTENRDRIPPDLSITLSDQSDGMIRDARRSIGFTDSRFHYRTFDCQQIPFEDQLFDLVIANHLLFYLPDPSAACREAARVLKSGGHFICSTYGASHMAEITKLVQEFDSRIVLSADSLYDKFGLENGRGILSPFFSSIEVKEYEDSLFVTDPQPLTEYILSCHGNQNQYLLNRYSEFHSFVQQKTVHGLYITKQAGIFICKVCHD